VAVRLGRVTAEYQDGIPVFSDDDAKAQFGLFTVNNIAGTKIVFNISRYDASGSFLGETAHTLLINESVDINGDGCADIEYKKPARRRAGFENAVYLTFLSSQETLNTTMFAVLQEQYARHIYPSGIIGINPAGQFIYSKYESGSGSRAVLSGIQKGDIVLDGVTGKYQKISRPASQNGARAVNESELEDIDESGIRFSVFFSTDDFVNTDAAEALFAALPESLKLKALSGNAIDKLNILLSSDDFIPLLAPEAELGATKEELNAAFAALPFLSQEELSQANRFFLEMVYPELCPLLEAKGSGFASALPLVSVIIDSGAVSEDAAGDTKDIGSSRAANQTEYNKQRSAINAKFAVYKNILSIPLQLPDEVSSAIPGSAFLNGSLKIGIKGSFNNTWGNISGSIEGAAYITADANIDCSVWGEKKLKNFSIGKLQVKDFIIPKTDLLSASDVYKNFLKKPLPGGLSVKSFEVSKNFPVVCFGPVTLNVRLGIGQNLYLETNLEAALKASGSVTAMYGGRAEIGINYGVSWKPVLKIFGKTILSIPVPYTSPYAHGNKVKEDSFQLSAEADEMELAYFGIAEAGAFGTLALTLAIHGEIGANICQIAGLDLGMEHGIELSAKPSTTVGFNSTAGISLPTLKIPGGASYIGALYLKPWVGLNVNIIGFIGYEKRFDFYTTKTSLGSVTLYNKTFGVEDCWAFLVKTLNANGTWDALEKRIGKDAVRSLKEGKLSGQQALAMLKSYIPFQDLLKIAQGIL
jgi:hypothetical protein